MSHKKIKVFQAIADSLGVPEAEVIDNDDGSTVTILGRVYMVVTFDIPRKHDSSFYNWAIFPISH